MQHMSAHVFVLTRAAAGGFHLCPSSVLRVVGLEPLHVLTMFAITVGSARLPACRSGLAVHVWARVSCYNGLYPLITCPPRASLALLCP